MTIDDFHRFILFLEDKGQTTWHPPAQIDDCLHRSSLDLFWFYAPIYGEDETAKKALDPFRVLYQLTGGNTPAGAISLPSDPTQPNCFAHLLSGTAVSFNNTINPATGQPFGTQYWPIEFVNDDDLPFRLASQIKPVSLARPIATTAGGGAIQLYPKVPNAGWITYLQLPTPPVYAYTTPVSPRVLVYNPVGSTQLQWNGSFDTKLIAKALVYLGINIDDDKMIQLMSQMSAS